MRDNGMVVARLHFDRPLQAKPSLAKCLRGAIGHLFPDEGLLHQHIGEKVAYRYPSVQFRWHGEEGWLVGQGEGAAFVLQLPLLHQTLDLGGERRRIEQIDYETGAVTPEKSEAPRLYRFLTPWLPFNQTLHQNYCTMTADEQGAERDRMARNQLLMTMKGIGFRVDWPLQAHVEITHQAEVYHKATPFLGFLGYLETNLRLPDHLAIGRAISHGYGWLVTTTTYLAMKKTSKNIDL